MIDNPCMVFNNSTQAEFIIVSSSIFLKIYVWQVPVERAATPSWRRFRLAKHFNTRLGIVCSNNYGHLQYQFSRQATFCQRAQVIIQ